MKKAHTEINIKNRNSLSKIVEKPNSNLEKNIKDPSTSIIIPKKPNEKVRLRMKKYVIMKMSFEEILRKLIEFDKFKYIYFENSNINLFNLVPNRPFEMMQLTETDVENKDMKDWKEFWDFNELFYK